MPNKSTEQKRRNANILVVALMLILALGAIIAAVLLSSGNKEEGGQPDAPPSASQPGTSETLSALETLAAQDQRVQAVIDNLDQYPDEFIELLLKNSDARTYVLNYPERKDDTAVGALTEEELSGGLPALRQWDDRWGYTDYGSGKLGITGCGPTCIAILAVGLSGQNVTPADVARFSEENNHYTAEGGTSWSLITEGAAHYGLTATPVTLWEATMIEQLEAGRPIVANVGPGDFTDFGHYLIITGYQDGAFTILDPNSPTKSARTWSYETLQPQISNIWAVSKAV